MNLKAFLRGQQDAELVRAAPANIWPGLRFGLGLAKGLNWSRTLRSLPAAPGLAGALRLQNRDLFYAGPRGARENGRAHLLGRFGTRFG